MKNIYLLSLFLLVVSCSNQNQLSYFCKGVSGNTFDYFITLNLNLNEGTIKKVLSEEGFKFKKFWDKTLDNPDNKEKYGEDYMNTLSNTFKEEESIVYIRNATDGFVSFAKFKEIPEYFDIIFTLNRTNLELRELTTYSDELSGAQEMFGKESVKYYKCEAPKV